MLEVSLDESDSDTESQPQPQPQNHNKPPLLNMAKANDKF